MTYVEPKGHGRRGRARALPAALPLLTAFALSGCGGLLDVELPGETEAGSLQDPAFAALMVTSAISDFECAFSQYALNSAILAGAFMDSQNVVSLMPYGMHNVRPTDGSFASGSCEAQFGGGLYTPLSTARWSADNAFRTVGEFPDADVPDKPGLLARAAAYAGYSYVIFGESFCEAAFDQGPALSPTQVLTLAEERFTTAMDLAQAAGDDETLNLARVGRARARLGLGKKNEAATDARLVPVGFQKNVTHSGANIRRYNKIAYTNVVQGRVSVEPAFRNLEFGGVPDRRVPVKDTGELGQDLTTPLWLQEKFTSVSDPIPLARYAEAQLIIAEVQGGQTAVNIINQLHSAVGLPAFHGTNSQEILDHVTEERRRELFLESHLMGDLQRHSLPFPTGLHRYKGWVYGTTTCFPLPDVERDNNPNIGR